MATKEELIEETNEIIQTSHDVKLYCIELNITSIENLETIEEYLNYILNLTDKRIRSFEIVDIEEH